MKTRIKFLGCGSAFSFVNGQNNLLLDIDEGVSTHRMLVDVGSQWQYMILSESFKDEMNAYGKEGYSYKESVARINLDIASGKIKEHVAMGKFVDFLSTLDSIFITHCHQDHCGNLELIGFMTRFLPNLKPLKLYGMAGCLEELWEHCLKAGMGCLNYGQMTVDERKRRIDIDSYFEPVYLSCEPEDAIRIGETIIEPFTTMHVSNRLKQVDSCGLLIKTFSGKEIMFTSDTQYCPKQLIDMYQVADVIFHDFETSAFPSGVHAHIEDMKQLPQEVKTKIKPCHYNDGFDRSLAEKYGFDTPVEMGDKYVFV